MRLLIIGQCTLHWGRMEFGNIGNYYIIEPFFTELKKVFPYATIKTTFQMSDEFCERHAVTILPMDYYYSWDEVDNNLAMATSELQIAEDYLAGKTSEGKTPFIQEVLDSDLVIDFSGDIWGDNADFLGRDRFLVGLYKNRVAQLLGKRTVMLAGSPGPFDNRKNLNFAKEVYASFDIVTNREPVSTQLLEKDGFDLSRTNDFPCPSFLFEPIDTEGIREFKEINDILGSNRPIVGFTLCGWNFLEGPFDKWPIMEEEFLIFVEAIEDFVASRDIKICLFSHSNGFPIPPESFELKRGRDFPIVKQLESILRERGKIPELLILNNVYSASQTKAIISKFDMLVSGRIHASVAGLSQNIPTVIIDYGHEPIAHKLKGFAAVANVANLVANPAVKGDLISKMNDCWDKKKYYKNMLEAHIPQVKERAKKNFVILKELI